MKKIIISFVIFAVGFIGCAEKDPTNAHDDASVVDILDANVNVRDAGSSLDAGSAYDAGVKDPDKKIPCECRGSFSGLESKNFVGALDGRGCDDKSSVHWFCHTEVTGLAEQNILVIRIAKHPRGAYPLFIVAFNLDAMPSGQTFPFNTANFSIFPLLPTFSSFFSKISLASNKSQALPTSIHCPLHLVP